MKLDPMLNFTSFSSHPDAEPAIYWDSGNPTDMSATEQAGERPENPLFTLYTVNPYNHKPIADKNIEVTTDAQGREVYTFFVNVIRTNELDRKVTKLGLCFDADLEGAGDPLPLTLSSYLRAMVYWQPWWQARFNANVRAGYPQKEPGTERDYIRSHLEEFDEKPEAEEQLPPVDEEEAKPVAEFSVVETNKPPASKPVGLLRLPQDIAATLAEMLDPKGLYMLKHLNLGQLLDQTQVSNETCGELMQRAVALFDDENRISHVDFLEKYDYRWVMLCTCTIAGRMSAMHKVRIKPGLFHPLIKVTGRQYLPVEIEAKEYIERTVRKALYMPVTMEGNTAITAITD